MKPTSRNVAGGFPNGINNKLGTISGRKAAYQDDVVFAVAEGAPGLVRDVKLGKSAATVECKRLAVPIEVVAR